MLVKPNDLGFSTEPKAAAERTLDAHGLRAVLKEAFGQRRSEKKALPDDAAEIAQTTPLDRPTQQKSFRLSCWTLAKTALALGLALAVGWEPLRTLLEPTSVEAVVNARLVSLKAPIAGEIVAQHLPAPGDMVGRESFLLRVINPRADRARLDELRRALVQLKAERPALAYKLNWAKSQHTTLLAQSRAFAVARLRELEARHAELQNQLVIASARDREAQSGLTRAQALSGNGIVSLAELERNQRDAAVARATVSVVRNQIAQIKVELDALKEGTFVGDDYNDRPSTAQMSDAIAAKISDMEADLKIRDARERTLAAELVQEERHFASISQFDVASPINGRIWEIMTAPGEQVAPGQDLLKLVDCSGAAITASVSETVYNQLSVGMPARFRLRDNSRNYEGVVVNLTGVASAAANLAIEPSSLIREPYRVMVAVPELAKGPDCNIGRTGRVYFNERQSSFSFIPFFH